MAQYTVPAADFRRAILTASVSVLPAKTAAKEVRPILAGFHIRESGTYHVDIVAADGFRMTVATIRKERQNASAPAVTLEAAPLIAYAKTIKANSKAVVTFAPFNNRDDATQWEFACSDHPAEKDIAVNVISGTYPDYTQIVPDITHRPCRSFSADAIAAERQQWVKRWQSRADYYRNEAALLLEKATEAERGARAIAEGGPFRDPPVHLLHSR